MNTDQQNNLYQEESIDIKKYLFKFLSNWYWFAITISVALAIAYMVNRYSEPIYTISSSLIISDKQSDVASVEAIIEELGRSRVRRKATVVNEISILKSYKIARMALEELDFGISYVGVGKREIAETKLYHNCPFIVIPDSSHSQIFGYPVLIKVLSSKEYLLEINDQYSIKKKLKFGETFESDIFKFRIVLRNPNYAYDENNSNKYYFFFNNINSLANQYRSRLNIGVNDEKGSILTLSIRGYVPDKMATYLNKLSEVYIRSELTEKNLRAENTIRFIDEQLQNIVKDLNAAEKRLQEFRTNNQVFNLTQKGDLLFTELTRIQSEKMPFEIKNRYYNYLKEYIKNQDKNDPIVAPSILNINDPTLQALVNQYNEKLSKQNSFSNIAKEDTPNIMYLQNELNKLLESIKELVVASQQTNQITLEAFNQKINNTNQKISLLPLNERQLINIEREYKLNNELYTFLLEKRAEAGITKASNIADNKILDTARPENAHQIAPNRSQNYMMALVLGLGIPGAIILAFIFLNNKIIDKKDIERNTNFPIIGTIGHNEAHNEVPVYLDPKSSISESFRSLRTNLQYILHEEDQKTIMITSTISGEGKTFASINLATIIAMSNKKVLLVGLDLRKPTLHKIFNVSNETGISTYLSNQSNYETIIKETYIENLHIAPSGPIPPNPAELIETNNMSTFFKNAVKEFDYVIVDTPPLALVTDAMLVSVYTNVNIFMIRQNYSNKQIFELINDIGYNKKIKNINLLINDLKVPKHYGYSYNYGYSYGYGYRYQEK